MAAATNSAPFPPLPLPSPYKPLGVPRFANARAVYKFKLRVFLDELDRKHGVGCYVLLYGGDPYVPERPDVAVLLRLAAADGARVLAVQCDEYSEFVRQQADSSTYDFLFGVCFYPTQRDAKGQILCEWHPSLTEPTRSTLAPQRERDIAATLSPGCSSP